jgi:hypothetical protein
MARLYRLGLNGRIRSDEMTRFIYALKEIRRHALLMRAERRAMWSRVSVRSAFQSPKRSGKSRNGMPVRIGTKPPRLAEFPEA